MPAVQEEVLLTRVLGQPRAGLSRHTFLGGNAFMLRMLNRYRDELGVAAPGPDLEAAARRTEGLLQSATASLALGRATRVGGELAAEVVVANLAGHKLPTAYPSRRAWLHLTVRDRAGRLLFESGAPRPDGSVAGTDNDRDPSAFEPHHREITRPDQVQVYESVMVDVKGSVTTGLLTAVRYVKDNRILPRGFDKATAPADVAVQGAAGSDPDFTGGEDRVRYRVEVGEVAGPLQVRAELWYQPIGFRWARNLTRYDAPETRRFVRYYDSMASSSATLLAAASASLP
jgi:hypothetical protein